MPRGKTKEELAEYGKNTRINGSNAAEMAKKSAEAKRAKKTFREEFEAELAAIIEIKDADGKVIDKTTVKNAITKNIVQAALSKKTSTYQKVKAAEFIRDTIGEKPVENVVVSQVSPDVVAEVEAMANDL